MKKNRENYTIDCLIAMKAHLYICGTRKCDLCLCKKLLIARTNSATLLNKCDEIVSKCRHLKKFTVKSLMILFVTVHFDLGIKR